ncbi:PH-domain-containing protein [Neoconidiobolus thromboides FSU 785]|nr:PH-domain-containing protein [Neoconidiobolus thromboides FSU 785]
MKSTHKRTPTAERFYPYSLSQGEYSDILDSIRVSLDKMLPERRHTSRRGSKGSSQGSSSSFEDDISQESDVSPSIQTLLDHLDACILKLDTPVSNEVASTTDNSKTNQSALSRNLEPSQYHEEKGFFNSTFGRRRSNFVLPTRDRQGSLASIATASTLNSASGSSPRSSSLNTSSNVTISEVIQGATSKGFLTKLFVTNPSFLARKSWKRRYFVLNGANLFRFKSDTESITCSEVFTLTSTCSVCVNESFPGKKFVIQLSEAQSNNTVYLLADNSDDLSHWLNSFKEAIARARFENEILPPSPEEPEFQSRLESRRSSSQTLPITFHNMDTDHFMIQSTRISRANSQPVIQTFPSLANTGRYSTAPSPLQAQKQIYVPETASSSSSPIFGKVNSTTRVRNSTNPRIPSLNVSRRPSLAPLQENDNDDSDFLKDVLEPITGNFEEAEQKTSTLMSLFSNDTVYSLKS